MFARIAARRIGAASNRIVGGVRRFGGDGHDHRTFQPEGYSKVGVGKYSTTHLTFVVFVRVWLLLPT